MRQQQSVPFSFTFVGHLPCNLEEEGLVYIPGRVHRHGCKLNELASESESEREWRGIEREMSVNESVRVYLVMA